MAKVENSSAPTHSHLHANISTTAKMKLGTRCVSTATAVGQRSRYSSKTWSENEARNRMKAMQSRRGAQYRTFLNDGFTNSLPPVARRRLTSEGSHHQRARPEAHTGTARTNQHDAADPLVGSMQVLA